MRAIFIYAVAIISAIFLDIKLIFTFYSVSLFHWYILFYGVFVQGISILLNWSFYGLKMKMDYYKKHKSNIKKVMSAAINPLRLRSREESNLRKLERLRRRVQKSRLNLLCYIAAELVGICALNYLLPLIMDNLAFLIYTSTASQATAYMVGKLTYDYANSKTYTT